MLRPPLPASLKAVIPKRSDVLFSIARSLRDESLRGFPFAFVGAQHAAPASAGLAQSRHSERSEESLLVFAFAFAFAFGFVVALVVASLQTRAF